MPVRFFYTVSNFQAQKIEKGLYLLLEETYRESKHGFETFVFHCNCGKEGRRKDCLLNNIEPLAWPCSLALLLLLKDQSNWSPRSCDLSIESSADPAVLGWYDISGSSPSARYIKQPRTGRISRLLQVWYCCCWRTNQIWALDHVTVFLLQQRKACPLAIYSL